MKLKQIGVELKQVGVDYLRRTQSVDLDRQRPAIRFMAAAEPRWG
jgi:hypothetical protein